MSISVNELSKNAHGGTELMIEGLRKYADPDLLDQVHIIPSRVRELAADKPNILWLHDMWSDPEAARLNDPAWRAQFDAIVFVSNWQRATYLVGHDMPYDGTIIMRNAIEPIPLHVKPLADYDTVIRIIYHTTPHRGLRLLVPVYERIYKDLGSKIHLDVYSSFNAYGWPERDNEFKEVFDRCREHAGITYHGYKPNHVVREALKEAHIFAYPSVWEETSCIAAMEAMSAGCQIVCSDLGALPETTAGYAHTYPYSSDPNVHMMQFEAFLRRAIFGVKEFSTTYMTKQQANFANIMYNWQVRGQQWNALLRGVIQSHDQKKVLH